VSQGDDDVFVKVTGLQEAVQMIRGPKGAVLHLKIAPGGNPDSEERVVRLVRDELKGVLRGGMQTEGLAWGVGFLSLGVVFAHL
jgi:hypothetical protein